MYVQLEENDGEEDSEESGDGDDDDYNPQSDVSSHSFVYETQFYLTK